MTVKLGRGEDIYELLKVYSLSGLGEESISVESIETSTDSGLPHGASGADVMIPGRYAEGGTGASPHRVSGADVWIPAHWLEFGAVSSSHAASGADVFSRSRVDSGSASMPCVVSGADVLTHIGFWPATFPATPILDNFNRADGPLGGDWAQYPSDDPLSIVSQQVKSIVAADGQMFYIHPLGADAEAYITAVSIDDLQGAQIILGDSPLTNEIGKGYYVVFQRDDTNGDTITLGDAYNGLISLGVVTVNYSAGDAIGIRAVGTTVKAFYKPVGGAWGEIISANISAVNYSRRSGYAVIFVSGSGAVDDFGGGPLAYGDTPGPAVYSSITTTSADITLDNSHHIILCDAALTVDLPSTFTYPTITYTIVRTGAGDVVIRSGTVGETISGAYPSITLDHQWQGVTVVADGYGSENWIVIDKFLGQETTGVTSASFTQNSGSDINDASTLDGYTLLQVVKALRNLGILE